MKFYFMFIFEYYFQEVAEPIQSEYYAQPNVRLFLPEQRYRNMFVSKQLFAKPPTNFVPKLFPYVEISSVL